MKSDLQFTFRSPDQRELIWAMSEGMHWYWLSAGGWHTENTLQLPSRASENLPCVSEGQRESRRWPDRSLPFWQSPREAHEASLRTAQMAGGVLWRSLPAPGLSSNCCLQGVPGAESSASGSEAEIFPGQIQGSLVFLKPLSLGFSGIMT